MENVFMVENNVENTASLCATFMALRNIGSANNISPNQSQGEKLRSLKKVT
jgi:hypothetical protein